MTAATQLQGGRLSQAGVLPLAAAKLHPSLEEVWALQEVPAV